MKIRNEIKNTIIILSAILLFGCGPKVSTSRAAEASLNTYETFAYLPNSNFDDIEKFDTDNSVGITVINRVNKHMKEEGYILDRENPDLLVLLTTSTDVESSVSADPVYATYPLYYNNNYAVSPYYQNYYYSNYNSYNKIIGYERDIDKYKEGTLILRLVDSDSKSIVWEATAFDFIGMNKNSKTTSSFVDDIFEEFPTK